VGSAKEGGKAHNQEMPRRRTGKKKGRGKKWCLNTPEIVKNAVAREWVPEKNRKTAKG